MMLIPGNSIKLLIKFPLIDAVVSFEWINKTCRINYPNIELDYSEVILVIESAALTAPMCLLCVRRRSSLIYVFRRACIRRGGSCEHRPHDCCYNSSCRCNLWGSNCRCQRMGLFQYLRGK